MIVFQKTTFSIPCLQFTELSSSPALSVMSLCNTLDSYPRFNRKAINSLGALYLYISACYGMDNKLGTRSFYYLLTSIYNYSAVNADPWILTLLPLRMRCITYTVLCTFDFLVSVRGVCVFTNILLLPDVKVSPPRFSAHQI